ncbi:MULTISPECIES: apolipoprotein N-acyltransferase [unclassified Sphingomonas]|uniref:apolipoprotein N-acyltransferase n=1 Tax=unclassified Sphingomonas TaxID=196159 RepID=UPI000BD67159|nr:MAG: apolipoprotein N-acyltransferase [Sphingomonas sp. 12-62-6]OYX37273.1 MAG: apolipoprotein N-acyltransferase [Sphingomonas sp. 32-62-10]
MTKRPALMSLILGAVAATGFAPLNLLPVTLACFAAWLLIVHDSPSLRAALWRGWLFGIAHFTIGNNWIARAFTLQDAMPAWLGYPAVSILAAYLAIYPMLAAGLMWRLASPRANGDSTTPIGGSYVLVAGAAWIVTEWLRGTMLTGYPWNPLAAIWLPLIGVGRSTSLIGTYALGGLSVVVAGALLLLVTQRRWRLAAPVLGATLLLAVNGIDLAQTPAAITADTPRIRVIQPNLDQEERPRDDYAEANLAAIARLMGTPGPAPRLIVWPEGALRLFVEDGYPPEYYWRGRPEVTRARIAAMLGSSDVVLAGGNGLQFDDRGQLSSVSNSVLALDSKARLLGRYDKAHLVPWGEYLPARPIMSAIGLSRLVPGDVDIRPGPGPAALDLPGFGLVGFQICYEIIFSGETVNRAQRPRFIFNPSNDSWYGLWGPVEHLAMARLRAIEEGLPVIRATPTGVSAIIDADGRVLASIPADRDGAIELPIPQPHPPTIFAMLGNWMAALVAAAMLALAVAIRQRAR